MLAMADSVRRSINSHSDEINVVNVDVNAVYTAEHHNGTFSTSKSAGAAEKSSKEGNHGDIGGLVGVGDVNDVVDVVNDVVDSATNPNQSNKNNASSKNTPPKSVTDQKPIQK